MVNPTGKKLEKLLFGIFDEAIQGVDTYNHNGSMWLIFTDEMRWVVEYTRSQTLWYNYYFFKQEMEIIGLDCVENKDLIQKWFESRFLNMGEVKMIDDYIGQDTAQVEGTIQNGVKSTMNGFPIILTSVVEDAIQNGVKDTNADEFPCTNFVEDTIQNGVKHTEKSLQIDGSCVIEDTIQNGVKHTMVPLSQPLHLVEDTIQNGVKNTDYCIHHTNGFVEDTIQNGVKDSTSLSASRKPQVEQTIKNGVKSTENFKHERIYSVDDTIQNGVKHTAHFTFLSNEVVEETIQNGIKDTKELKHDRNSYHGHFILEDEIPTHIPMVQVQDVIQEGVKEIKTVDDSNLEENAVEQLYRHLCVDDTIQNGVKETKSYVNNDFDMNDAIQNGVKKIRWNGELGTHLYEDVIKNGVKHTESLPENNPARIEDAIQNGVKDMKESHFYRKSRITDVTQDGVKEVIELPELNPDLNGYGEYYSRNKNMKYPFTDIVEDVIKENNKLS